MDAPVSSKAAPAKMVHFLADLLTELRVPGTLVAVEVEDASYRVTLALAERGLAVYPLSAWDVSRSLRGDPAAREALGRTLARLVAGTAG